MNEAEKIDIAFFDISMPKKNHSNLEDGIDLAMYFKTKHPNAKIVFITMHSEFHILIKPYILLIQKFLFQKMMLILLLLTLL